MLLKADRRRFQVQYICVLPGTSHCLTLQVSGASSKHPWGPDDAPRAGTSTFTMDRLIIYLMADMEAGGFWVKACSLKKHPQQRSVLRGGEVFGNDWKRYDESEQIQLGSDSYADINQKKVNTWTKNRNTQNCCKFDEHKYQYLAQVWHSEQSAHNIKRISSLNPTDLGFLVYKIQWNRSKWLVISLGAYYCPRNEFLYSVIFSALLKKDILAVLTQKK